MSSWFFSVPTLALTSILMARAHRVASLLYVNSLYTLKFSSSTVSNILEIIREYVEGDIPLHQRWFQNLTFLALAVITVGLKMRILIFLVCIGKVHSQNYYCS